MEERLAPVRIGILDDTPGGGIDQAAFGRTAELVFDDVGSRFPRPVEFVFERADGLPWGTAKALEDAYSRLVEAGVIAVLGPAMGDDATIATELAEAARMPTFNWAGTEKGRSEFMFHLQIGSHEDEPLLLARHLVETGRKTVAMVFERAMIGERYGRFFEEACHNLGVDMVARIGVAPGTEDLSPVLDAVERAGADAIAYMGLGLCHAKLAEGLRRIAPDTPWITTAYGMFGWADAEAAKALDGWIYVDEGTERNPVLTKLAGRLDRNFDHGFGWVFHYELLRLLAEALARAPELTRAGVRDGFERIKPLPSPLGEPGTFAGFGHWERGALKGPYLVLRRWEGGKSVEL